MIVVGALLIVLSFNLLGIDIMTLFIWYLSIVVTKNVLMAFEVCRLYPILMLIIMNPI